MSEHYDLVLNLFDPKLDEPVTVTASFERIEHSNWSLDEAIDQMVPILRDALIEKVRDYG